jgi:hypothetical protein
MTLCGVIGVVGGEEGADEAEDVREGVVSSEGGLARRDFAGRVCEDADDRVGDVG